jgi:hypothetical protein
MKARIIKQAKALGLCIHREYSGRYMFGRTCLGVAGAMETLDELLSTVRGSARGLRKDQLGKGYIYYWEHIA